MKNFNRSLMLTALLACSTAAFAGTHAGAPMAMEGKKEMPMAASGDMAEGEVRKIDKASKKITLKHGEIKSLDMPPMTMVFQVQDPALLDLLKPGDKVRFKAEKSGTAMMVTDIQAAK